PTASAITARTASLTRLIRSVIGRHHQAVAARQDPVPGGEPPFRPGSKLLRLVRGACSTCDREGSALPQLVVIDLGDARTEAVAEVVLRGAHEVALALQGRRFGEVELDREDGDETRAHSELAGSSSDVRSTSRVSYTSKTSPSRRSLNPSRRIPHSK